MIAITGNKDFDGFIFKWINKLTVSDQHLFLSDLKALPDNLIKSITQAGIFMNRSEALQKIKQLINNKTFIDADGITEQSKLMDDCGLDSLDMVELCMNIEAELNIEIPDDEAELWAKVSDVVDSYLKER